MNYYYKIILRLFCNSTCNNTFRFLKSNSHHHHHRLLLKFPKINDFFYQNPNNVLSACKTRSLHAINVCRIAAPYNLLISKEMWLFAFHSSRTYISSWYIIFTYMNVQHSVDIFMITNVNLKFEYLFGVHIRKAYVVRIMC